MHTMKDVANLANVSVATVSNYINNTKKVSPKVASKIAKAIETLQYVPNAVAKSLKDGYNKEIGVILPNLFDGYYMQLLHGIENIMNENSINMLVATTNDVVSLEQKQIHKFLEKKVAGIILVTSQPENTDFFKTHIVEKNIPFVHIDRQINIENLNFLGFDNESAFYNLTKHFLQNNNKKIALFVGKNNFSCEQDSITGYIKAYNDCGIQYNKNDILHTLINKEAGFRTSLQYLTHNKPDVIIATSKLVAAGIAESIAVFGYQANKDITIITLDEDNWNLLSNGRYEISIRRQAINIGNEAAELLCSQINTTEIHEPKHKMLPLKIYFPTNNVPHIVSKSKTKLNVLMLDTLQVELFKGLLPLFQKTANIDISITKVPHSQMLQSIYENKNNYDVLMYDIPWLYSLASDKIIADITEELDSNNFDKSIYIEGCMDNFCKYNNKYYGLPFMYAPQILFYRKDLFEDKNIIDEYKEIYNANLQPPRTWKEFNNVAKFFTQSENPTSKTKYGTAVSAAYVECLLPEIYMRMRAYGSQVFNNHLTIVFNSLQTSKTYNNFVELIKNHVPNPLQHTDVSVVDEFLAGNIAMLVTYPSFISNINDIQRSYLNGKIGFSHIPCKSPILGGWGLAVSESSINKEAAFQFIKWTCGKEISNYSTIMAGQSAIKDTFSNNELTSLYPWLPLYKEVAKSSECIIPPVLSDNNIIPQYKIDEIIAEEFYNIMNNESSIETGISITHSRLYRLFKEYMTKRSKPQTSKKIF